MEIPPNDYDELQEAIEQQLKANKLQIVPEFTAKIVQLYDTMQVRYLSCGDVMTVQDMVLCW